MNFSITVDLKFKNILLNDEWVNGFRTRPEKNFQRKLKIKQEQNYSNG
jgi:hypothetical protein